MLRSAHCLGADGVLASAKNCAPLSAVVSKASAGALEVMTLHAVGNLPRALTEAAERGWAVVGAAAERDATPLGEFVVDRPTVLVMGESRCCLAKFFPHSLVRPCLKVAPFAASCLKKHARARPRQ